MAYINATRSSYALVDRFGETLKSLKETMHRRRVYRTTVRELSALSGRELADLGMHRSMISEVAREAAYGK